MMSSLLASILLLIALMLGAVLVFDLWRARRMRKARLPDGADGPTTAHGASARKGSDAASEPTAKSGMSALADETDETLSGMPKPQADTRPLGSDTGTARPAVHTRAEEPARRTPPLPAVDVSPTANPAGERDEPALAGPLLSLPEGPPGGRTEPSLGSIFEGNSPRPAPTYKQPEVTSAPVFQPEANSEASSGPPRAVSEARATQPTSAANAQMPASPNVVSGAPRVLAKAAIAPPAVLSERTDCLLVLRPMQVLDGDRIMLLSQDFRRVGAKPVLIEACADDDASPPGASGDGDQAEVRWEGLRSGARYRAVRVGVLMANRAGSLNAMEYSDFIARVRQLGEQLGCRVIAPDMASVLSRARAMDSECMRLDAQIGLNVQTAEALTPARLAGLAGRLMVAERGNNRYARLTRQGQIVFSVALADQPNRLGFLLDVPRVAEALAPWTAMSECARVAAQLLEGHLVDDAGRELSPRAVEQIGGQLEQRYRALEAAGLAAGSAAALRVFN